MCLSQTASFFFPPPTNILFFSENWAHAILINIRESQCIQQLGKISFKCQVCEKDGQSWCFKVNYSAFAREPTASHQEVPEMWGASVNGFHNHQHAEQAASSRCGQPNPYYFTELQEQSQPGEAYITPDHDLLSGSECQHGNCEIDKKARGCLQQSSVLRVLAQELRCSSASQLCHIPSHAPEHAAMQSQALCLAQWPDKITQDLSDQKNGEKPDLSPASLFVCQTVLLPGSPLLKFQKDRRDTVRALLRGVGHWRHVESVQSVGMYPKRLANVCGCLAYSRTWTLEQTSGGI